MAGRRTDQFAREHRIRSYAGEGSAGAPVTRECVFCLKRQTILAGKARLRGSPPGFFKLYIGSRSIRICQSQNPILAISPSVMGFERAQKYGGLAAAAAALGYSSVQVLQNDIDVYCAGP
jgi:hypothetical protein